MNRQLKLSLLMTADASSLKREGAEARAAIDGVGEAAQAAAPKGAAAAAANDQVAASSRRAADAAAGQLRAETSLAEAINRRMGIARQAAQLGDPFAANPRRAADIAAYGAALDDLRAKYNPLFAEERRHAAELASIRQAHRVGAIASGEMAGAIQRERAAHAASVTAIRSRTAALREMGAAGRAETANIAAQFQDVGVTAAMGMSPMMIALQQGTQLSAVLNSMQNPVRGLGAALLSVVNPVSLVTIGLVGLTAAAIQYFTSTEEGADAVERVLEAHGKNIADIRKKWGEAAAGIDEYQQKSGDLLIADAIVIGDELRKQIEAAAQALIDGGQLLRTETQQMQDEVWRLAQEHALIPDPNSKRAQELFEEMVRLQMAIAQAGSDALVATEEFKPLRQEIDAFFQSVRAGTPDFVGLQDAVAKALRADPTNQELIRLKRRIDELTAAGADLQRRLPGNAQVIDGVGDAADRAAPKVSAFAEALAALGRIAPASLNDAARAAEAFEKGIAGATSIEEELALLKEYEQAIARIREQRRGSLLDDLAKKEREVQIGAMSDRDAAAARIRDEYRALVDGLREAGAAEADVERATRIMNEALAQSAAHFDEIERKAGEKGATKELRSFEREAERAAGQINGLFTEVGNTLAGIFERPIESVWDFVDAVVEAVGQIGQKLMSLGEYDWARRLGLVAPTADPVAGIAAAAAAATRAAPASYIGSPAHGARGASELQGYVPRAVGAIERTSNAFLSLVRRAEGTAGANGYNVTLGYGAFTGGATNLTGMTLNQIDALQTGMLRHPANGFNSSAVGAYQIVRTTLRGLRDELKLSGDQLFTPQLQDELAMHLAGRRGASVAGLRNEWEGLRRVDGGTILTAFRGAANSNVPVAANSNVAPAAAPAPVAVAAAPAGPSGAAGTWSKVAAIGGAAASGFASGYQAQNPFMGAFSGALGGIGAGPWGIAAGLLGGLIGGILGLVKAVQEARAELKRLGPEIETFVSAGFGTGVSAMAASFRDYAGQAREYMDLAEKAYDFDTYKRLAGAVEGYQRQIAADFSSTFTATLESLRSGFGADGEWVAAQRAVLDLREELKAFVADAEWVFGAGSQRAGQARTAAAEALLAQLDDVEQLSAVAARLEQLGGTASVLRAALVDLGMSGDDAARLIRERLVRSIDAVRDGITNDLNRSILDLSGRGHVNEMADAVARFNARVAEMQAAGLDASGAQDELALALAAIADRAGIGADELAAFARAAGLSTAAIGGATGALEQLARQRRLDDLRATVMSTQSTLTATLTSWKGFVDDVSGYLRSIMLDPARSILSPRDQFAAAQAEYRRLLASAPDTAEGRGQLTQAAETYRARAADMFSSSEGYVAVVREIEAGLGGVRAKADTQISLAERQLAAAQSQIDWLEAANDNVVTLTRATTDFKAAVDAYLGAEGTLTGPVTAAMAGTVSAAEAAVAAAAAAATASDLTARSAQAIAQALLNPPAKFGELPSRATDDQKADADRRATEEAARKRMEEAFPGLYSQYGGDIEKWRKGQQTVLERITEWTFGPNSFLGGLFGFAEGGAFDRHGIVDRPTVFRFAKGTGLMGEAGPEAILPLARGRGGQLGVMATVQGGAGPGAGNDNRTLADIRDILADGLARIEGAVLAQGGGSEKAAREFARMREELLLARTTPPRATGTGGW